MRTDFQNKEMIEDTWYPVASLITLKYFLENDARHKSRVHYLGFNGAFIQDNVKHRVF